MNPQQDENKDYDIFREADYSSLEVVEQKPINSEPDLPKKHRNKHTRKQWILRILLTVIGILALLGAMGAIVRTTQKPSTTITVNTQSLDNGTLNQLSESSDGAIKQQLTISPETLFKESVTVQGSAEVQQDLTVKGQTVLQGAVIAEQDVTFNRGLTVANNTSIGGNLSVSGSITASSLSVGTITISTVDVSSDVSFGGHLIPSGAAPTTRPSLATSGGTVTVSGNDTAGTITIIIGNGAVQNGELAIVTFNKPFTLTPKVQLTPINPAASNLNYYATRTAGFFTIQTTSTPTNGATYVFDYLVTQ